jgi:hypothetical protein
MPAKSPRNPALNRGPSTTWQALAKVSHPRPENLYRRLAQREHAGVVQVVSGACKLFPTAS